MKIAGKRQVNLLLEDEDYSRLVALAAAAETAPSAHARDLLLPILRRRGGEGHTAPAPRPPSPPRHLVQARARAAAPEISDADRPAEKARLRGMLADAIANTPGAKPASSDSSGR